MNRLGRYEGWARLILLLVVVPCVAYCFAFARTRTLWKEVRQAEQEIAQAMRGADLSSVPSVGLDSVELIANGGVLEKMKLWTHDEEIKIVRYTPYITQEGEDFILRTAEVILSGTFIPLLRALNDMEQHLGQCRFLSSEFRIVRRGKQTSLQLIIIIQQLTDKSLSL